MSTHALLPLLIGGFPLFFFSSSPSFSIMFTNLPLIRGYPVDAVIGPLFFLGIGGFSLFLFFMVEFTSPSKFSIFNAVNLFLRLLFFLVVSPPYASSPDPTSATSFLSPFAQRLQLDEGLPSFSPTWRLPHSEYVNCGFFFSNNTFSFLWSCFPVRFQCPSFSLVFETRYLSFPDSFLCPRRSAFFQRFPRF